MALRVDPEVHESLEVIKKHTKKKRPYRKSRYGITDEEFDLDLSPVLRQMVKTQNPLNGELSHGVVT